MSQLGVDTRSDIYSLGVLALRAAHRHHAAEQSANEGGRLRRNAALIKEEEPPKPSTRLSESGEALASIAAQRQTEPAKLAKLVRGELDWIVMKSLEKDRKRRYETASGFAADVERYLNDEPVQACPPSAGYRFRKFARRNKAALASTGLVMLVLTILTGSIGWNYRDRAARQTAVEQEVNLALKEAEQWQQQEKWPEALSAAKRAQGLLVGGGSDGIRDRAHQLRKDLEMVLRLEEIPLLSSELKDNSFDWEAADRAYAHAFRDYGIDVFDLDNAAVRIRARTGVAIALAAALDDWDFARSKAVPAAHAPLTACAGHRPRPLAAAGAGSRQAERCQDVSSVGSLAGVLAQPPTSLLVLARAMRAGGLAEAEISVLRQRNGIILATSGSTTVWPPLFTR